MTYDRVHTPDLDIGQIIQRTFGVIGRNFVVILVFGLVLAAVPAAFLQWALHEFTASRVLSTPGASPIGPKLEVAGAAYVLELLGLGLMRLILVGVVVDDAKGERASFGGCLRSLARSALPGLATEFLLNLGTLLLMILFIVPGIIFALTYGVVVPVVVTERRGVFASFSRAAKLTSGKRGAIFGATILIGLIGGLINIVPAGIAVALTMQSGLQNAGVIIQGFSTGLVTILSLTATSVIYLRLVTIREGGQSDTLAQVFT